MKKSLTRPLVATLLLVVCLGSTSCATVGSLVGLPVRLAGGILSTALSNPVGTAATAAAIF